MLLFIIILTLQEGYGVRLKAIYQLSSSKLIDVLVSITKQALSAKLGNRIRVLKNLEAVHEHIPKEILPKDYDGNEKSLAELQGKTILIRVIFPGGFKGQFKCLYFCSR